MTSVESDKEKISKYYKYYEEQYLKVIGLGDLNKLASVKGLEWIRSLAGKFSYPFSSIWRHENLANIKYLMTPRKLGQITTVFKISRSDGKKQVTTSYAILYSHMDGKKAVHDFVTVSPTYKSSDGEYRHRFIPVKQLLAHETNYPDLYESVERHLIKKAKDGKIILQATTACEDSNIRKRIDKSVDQLGLALVFYATEWFSEFSRYLRGRSENHIVSGYHEAMFGEDDMEIWNANKEFLTIQIKSELFYRHASRIVPNPNQKRITTECGQKLVPLTVRDVESADDIRLAPWREMYITSLVGDLVVSGITHGVPLLGDWFFIELDSSMFDNEISAAKLKHSEVASDIVRRLESTRRNTYLLDPVNNKEIYLSYKMAGLSDAVDIPMNYAERELVMSDLCLCAVEEHLGRTVGDLPNLMMHDSYSASVGPMFSEYIHFARYCFEFVYTLHCLNKFLGVIHGDPHPNNVTIYTVADRFLYNKSLIKNPHIIYRVEDSLYIFPTKERCAAFIDFSRGFVWSDALSKDYTETQIAQIRSNYQTRILTVLHDLLPTYMEDHSADVELAFNRHFDLAYKVFAVLDTYRLMAGLDQLFTQQVLGVPKHLKTYCNKRMLNEQALPLLANLRDRALELFTQQMELLIKAPRDRPPTIPDLNLLLLQEYFKEFLIQPNTPEPLEPITLVDYWSDQNELRYNIRHYDSFPPTVKFDYVLANGIDTDKWRIAAYYESEAYKEVHDPDTVVEEIAEAERKRKEERRGTPAANHETVEINKKLAPYLSDDDVYYSS